MPPQEERSAVMRSNDRIRNVCFMSVYPPDKSGGKLHHVHVLVLLEKVGRTALRRKGEVYLLGTLPIDTCGENGVEDVVAIPVEVRRINGGSDSKRIVQESPTEREMIVRRKGNKLVRRIERQVLGQLKTKRIGEVPHTILADKQLPECDDAVKIIGRDGAEVHMNFRNKPELMGKRNFPANAYVVVRIGGCQ
jgi:hypothetical protein